MNELKRILVVDDDAINVDLLLTALSSQGFPHETVVARDGAEALDYLFARGRYLGRGGPQPVVVLLDLKMPGVDGFEVLRQVKSDGTLRLVPVVVFSSSNEEGDRLQSYRLSANAYVVKPVAFSEFRNVVQAVCRFWTDINQAPPAVAGERREAVALQSAAA
jgi:CheY-like chemotaxis protein